MEFVDLKTQYARIQDDINRRIQKVLQHGRYIMGPEVEELEDVLARYVCVKHCIGVSSGTDGLLVALMALEVSAGDEVITTPFTFIATGEMILLLGATPIFVDIDPRTYNIDATKVESAITKRTKVILPVSLYGQCADFDVINGIANKHGIPVVEDAAQSFGATYKGHRSCGLSTIGVTSFFPSKPLGCYGDAGAIFTDDDELATRMRRIRVHGQDKRYHHTHIGINARLDTLQAAVLLAKFKIFPDEIRARQEVAEMYNKLLKDTVPTPYIEPHNQSVYAQYTIQARDRDDMQQKLKDQGIPTAVHYPTPISMQPAIFKKQSHVPIAVGVAAKVISLPMHPYLQKKQQEHIVNALREYLSN